jgi:hypothetical protein
LGHCDLFDIWNLVFDMMRLQGLENNAAFIGMQVEPIDGKGHGSSPSGLKARFERNADVLIFHTRQQLK